MTTIAIPRARLRVRRPKPPSKRKLFWLAVLGLILGFVAHDVLMLMRGHPMWLINLAVWSIAFATQRRNYECDKRLEDRADDARLPPISPFLRGWVMFAVAFQAWEWATL